MCVSLYVLLWKISLFLGSVVTFHVHTIFAYGLKCVTVNLKLMKIEVSVQFLCFKQIMVCTKWRQRQRHLVVLSLLLTAVATMIPENSLEALKQNTNGQIMVSTFLTADML